MNRIRLLPEHVANQIAAGEVVERPASVVKELVENALDAQARHITVEIQAGGRSLIRVSDDGAGMTRDDALLCLERHATSKIIRAEDLAAITTMGFRGEALPSIASVSRLTLTTRERESGNVEGTEVVIHGGKILQVKAAGSPTGTTVEVRQLFFNLPARRKFLRSEETEYTHIHHYLTLAALANPEAGFTFVKDGRVVWKLAPGNAERGQVALAGGENAGRHGQAGLAPVIRERLRALLTEGAELLPVESRSSLPDFSEAPPADLEPGDSQPLRGSFIRVWGFIGKPGCSRATRQDQHLFVNRRPVENRTLNFALLEGYHTALMKGRYPVCCLFLELDPALVDVNIHPAKREVKFHNDKVIRQAVTQAVRESLLSFTGSSDAVSATSGKPSVGAPTTAAVSRAPGEPADATTAEPVARPREFPQFSPLTGTPFASGPAPAPHTGAPIIPAQSKAAAAAAASSTEPAPASPPPPALASKAQSTPQPGEPVPLLKVPLRLIGVLANLYVLFESDRGLVLLDQHAAHERVLFEQMLSRLEHGEDAPSQKLLLPETIELSVRDAHFVRELLPTLNRLGVGLSEFGERTFLLDALPPFVKGADGRGFMRGLIDELKAAGEEVNTLRLGEQMIAKTVCRHAVKANDPLAGPELDKLVNDLRHCAMPYTCPHGRPTLLEMNLRELEKKFGRVV